jgi:hypothetical protein
MKYVFHSHLGHLWNIARAIKSEHPVMFCLFSIWGSPETEYFHGYVGLTLMNVALEITWESDKSASRTSSMPEASCPN